MKFKRARTNEQIEVRRKEILNACAELFDNGDVDDVHFKAIGEKTSFARSTIYKYYSTKEEILLDLLSIDIMKWIDKINLFTDKYDKLTKENFCYELTTIYLSCDRLLRLLSILYSVLEKNSSLEKLIEFKRSLIGYEIPVSNCVRKYFPDATDDAIYTFISTTSSYILGVYPSTHISEKQQQAIELSGYEFRKINFQETCYKGFLLIASVL
jgi:AcrR family transcriptional regulator